MPALAAQEATIAEIRFQGNSSIPEEELLNAIALKPGDAYDPGRVAVAERMARNHYGNQGYLEARVSSQVRVRQSSVTLVMAVEEGPRYRFGATRIAGLRDLSKGTVIRELACQEGDRYDRRRLFQTRSRLFGLGFFEDVSVEVTITTARTAEPLIRLRERPLKWIRGGVGYGAEERGRLTLLLTHNNFLRRAYKLELTDSLSAIHREVQAELFNRYLFGTRTEHRSLASWRHEDQEGYDFERVLAQVALARRLPYGLGAGTRYRLQRVIIFHATPELLAATALAGSAEGERPSAPSHPLSIAADLSLSRETTDDPFFPSRGKRWTLLLERSGGFLGGDVHFNRTHLRVSDYSSWGSAVLALGGRAGVVREFPPSEEVPIYERFFLGGANSLRGYGERGAGPKDAEGSPLGGNVVTGGHVELRFPLNKRLNGAVFTDGGQVSPRGSQTLPKRWKYSAGAGFRVVTPVGPLRLDWGYKLNPDPGVRAKDLWRFHLSLGEAF